MNEDKNVATSDIEKKAMLNLAKAENAPVQVDRSIPGADMTVMTIIAIIAIICIAVSVVTSITNPNRGTMQVSAQKEIATYSINPAEYTELPEGIAAVVNGVEIPESRVTDYIENYRKTMDLEEEEAWTQYVFEGEMYGTTENLRNYILNILINQELVTQAAAEVDLAITDEEIDEFMEQDAEAKGFASRDAYWESVLSSGYNEDFYISQARNSLLQDEIVYMLIPQDSYVDTIDQQTLDYIKQSYPAYVDIESLDEVSENLQAYAHDYVVYLNNTNAYNEFMSSFIKDSVVEVAPPPADLSYGVDTGKLQLEGFIDDLKRRFEIQSQLGGEENADEIKSLSGSALDSPDDPQELEGIEEATETE